jgi:hypothetical protein
MDPVSKKETAALCAAFSLFRLNIARSFKILIPKNLKAKSLQSIFCSDPLSVNQTKQRFPKKRGGRGWGGCPGKMSSSAL